MKEAEKMTTEENPRDIPHQPSETEAALRRAAQAMSSITDVASRFLVAYIKGGGTWNNLGPVHINKAYDLAIEFMSIGEERWVSRMKQILEGEQPTGGGGGVDESLPMDLPPAPPADPSMN